jgi:hypothetical protein
MLKQRFSQQSPPGAYILAIRCMRVVKAKRQVTPSKAMHMAKTQERTSWQYNERAWSKRNVKVKSRRQKPSTWPKRTLLSQLY